MKPQDDGLFLIQMAEMVKKAQGFLDGKSREDYDAEEVLRLALIHIIQTIGEAARHVSLPTQQAMPTIPWKSITGMRHRIVHNYAQVDEDVVWQTLQYDLPILAEALKDFE